MGKKLLVALAMEGKFASQGLQAIDGDDDILTAIARELVESKGIGESADSPRKNLQGLRPAQSSALLEAADDRAIKTSEIEIPAMAIESVAGGVAESPSIPTNPRHRQSNRPSVGLLST